LSRTFAKKFWCNYFIEREKEVVAGVGFEPTTSGL
jgi:hypothetical protein